MEDIEKKPTGKEQKLDAILGLLNNCREKMKSLCLLFNNLVLQTKQDVLNMNLLLNDVITAHDDLKGIARVLPMPKDRNRVVNASKPIVNRVSNNVKDYQVSFGELYTRVNSCLDEPKQLKEAYKNDIKSCCEAFKKIFDVVDNKEPYKKGYCAQIKIIKKILDKIKSLDDIYNQEKAKAEQVKIKFNELIKFINKLANDLNGLAVGA